MKTIENISEVLTSEACELLGEFNYDYSSRVVRRIIDTSMENKSWLRELFEKHPNYNGRLQIVFSSNYNREVDEDVVDGFYRYLRYTISAAEMLTVVDKSYQYISEDEVSSDARGIYSKYKIRAGQRRSRVIGKMAKQLSVDKHERWNAEFAKYSDAINPLAIVRHTVISINPIDYWTMSFGNSWASCHTIDINNIRHMPDSYSGCYSSGTESYMLDESSIVFYTVDSSYNGDCFELQDKINRCMFHAGPHTLVQGRVYPQCNDDDSGIYKQIREIMQKVFADCLGVDNMWRNKKGMSECSSAIYSRGTHYKDYLSFGSCNVSRLTAFPDDEKIYVGHNPICPNCGNEHYESDNIMCEDCQVNGRCCVCGGTYDLMEIDGEYYCCDHYFYCEYHHQHEPHGNGSDYCYVENYGDVCDYAIDFSGDFFVDAYSSDVYHITDMEVETADGQMFASERNAVRAGYECIDGEWVEKE